MTSEVRLRLRGELAVLLEELAAVQGVDVGTAISRALSHEALLESTMRAGGQVILRDANGRQRELLVREHARWGAPADPGWPDPWDDTTVELLIPEHGDR
ncbi:hypothetical protein ER308_18355 [Egibacter rhizosphaerae]|uniref:Uncharacterized protein n=1 Tax=Egibacter rhizosphaerae TaxID=1670831 RepID=A0A411YJF2_9ACTN|nr:hypothetical protein [Egibacter rhizosphaerae]QBI21337.1 hypothetical protein ER308_18355 [Egibacter rhizosphaerae]